MKNTILLMLPYAGGKAWNLMALAAEITGIDTKILEWPGRGTRIHEPLLTDMEVIAADLLNQAYPLLKQYHHFAVYGHSMGTTAGYMLIHKIAALSGRYPLHFFVSGSGGPVTRKKSDWHSLPKETFWEKVKTLGGCPDEVLEYPELLDFAEPILRADFEALGNFKYTPMDPMPLPITAFRGTGDEQDLAAFEAWQKETTLPLTLIELEGDHFFIFQNGPAIGSYISNVIKDALQKKYAR
jgi:medium-chain acyl-[acyl-carrier-protein] hydrolase